MSPSEIKAARVRLGMTQPQFAEACELGKGGARVVRGWEKGEYRPGRRSLRRIAELLDGGDDQPRA